MESKSNANKENSGFDWQVGLPPLRSNIPSGNFLHESLSGGDSSERMISKHAPISFSRQQSSLVSSIPCNIPKRSSNDANMIRVSSQTNQLHLSPQSIESPSLLTLPRLPLTTASVSSTLGVANEYSKHIPSKVKTTIPVYSGGKSAVADTRERDTIEVGDDEKHNSNLRIFPPVAGGLFDAPINKRKHTDLSAVDSFDLYEDMPSPKQKQKQQKYSSMIPTEQIRNMLSVQCESARQPLQSIVDAKNDPYHQEETSADDNNSNMSLSMSIESLDDDQEIDYHSATTSEKIKSPVRNPIQATISTNQKYDNEDGENEESIGSNVARYLGTTSIEARMKQTKSLPINEIASSTSNVADSKSLRSISREGLPPLALSREGTSSNTKNSKPNLLLSSRLYTRMGKAGNSTRIMSKLGMPKRADPEQEKCNDSSDDESVQSQLNKKSILVVTQTTTPPSSQDITTQRITKFRKEDFSYIVQWDPTKRSQSSDTKSSGDRTAKEEESVPECDTEKVPKQLKNGEAIGSFDYTPTSLNVISSNTVPADGQPGNDTVDSKTTRDIVKTTTTEINPMFRSLVSDKNMIYVNGVAYAKLGVVGKGGSSKVYRALSSVDYATVAIKKVKTSGMDAATIYGYSNEIKLLERLRGNDSIIQLIDSEVDTKSRNAIFLVMEAGEVDLNYALQKQALEFQKSMLNRTGKEVIVPNMNFIRLIWQQMLTAVHSMHEERIIHGDLKPANFLFVRGSLKLIDFGIAKAIQSEDTTNIYRESHIGTINYMSPESILADTSAPGKKKMKCGRASDIWSLGCILYQMVYGKTPFYDLPIYEKMRAIVDPKYYTIPFPEIKLKSGSSANTGATSGVAGCAIVDAIQQCLRWQPSDRPQIVGNGGLLNDHPFLNSL